MFRSVFFVLRVSFLRFAWQATTLLVHLGYLTCDFDTKTAWIPNKEGRQEFLNSIQGQEFQNVNNAIHRSDKLLQLTLAQNAEKVEL